MESDGSVLRWWTFAGGRVNYTFKFALEMLSGWKIVADNFLLRIEGDGVSIDRTRAFLARLAAPAFWGDAEQLAQLRARLPPYRLSKFQDAMPDAAQTEWIGRYLLDVSAMAGVAKVA